MDQNALHALLDHLISEWENETVEFKQAGNDHSTPKIGQYCSALANEANLRSTEKAWLVFGVDNQTRRVTGTNYRPDSENLQSLKMQVQDMMEPNITFRNIYELNHPDGRVILFEIPAAPRGMPIACNGHFYARAGESLTNLSLDKIDEIRAQTAMTDWSAQIVPDATLDDLDPVAVQKARDAFTRKHSGRFSPDEIEGWTTAAFLDRAKITQNGKITRAALLLLGKAEATHFLLPHPAQMTWKLEGPEHAYEHFGPPFFLNSTRLYKKIRNIQIQMQRPGELMQISLPKYEQKIVLEALHNCIAHQDYTRDGRINVIERPDRLVLENEGGFFEGQPDDYALGEKMPRRYRNAFLVEAMVSLNMIDKMGYGIYDMHKGQASRYFPLPDYDLSEENAVRMTVYGGIVDPAYSQLLMRETDLPLADILALDRIQKKLPVPDAKIAQLRRAKLIEGRKPHLHVSAAVADATAQKAEYIRTRTLDKEHYNKLILDYLKKFESASRKEIDGFLWDKLSDALNDYQKRRKIGNLLSELRRAEIIYNAGSKHDPRWRLK